MQKNFQNHSSTLQFNTVLDDKKKYAKLTPEIKKLFISKIVFEHLSIKDASELLNINYSSAKAIASCHKKLKAAKLRKSPSKKATKTCQYKMIQQKNQCRSQVRLVQSSIGGIIVQEKMIPKHKHVDYLVFPIARKVIPQNYEQMCQDN